MNSIVCISYKSFKLDKVKATGHAAPQTTMAVNFTRSQSGSHAQHTVAKERFMHTNIYKAGARFVGIPGGYTSALSTFGPRQKLTSHRIVYFNEVSSKFDR